MGVVPGDFADLRVVLPALLERIAVLHRRAFARSDDPELVVRPRFPDAHVPVVRTSEHEPGVECVQRRGDSVSKC